MFHAKCLYPYDEYKHLIMDQTALFYSRPSHGAGFPVFMGSRRQRGGGIFGSLKNFFLPVAKKVGRSLFSQGVGLAKDVMQDALEGKNIKSSFLDRGKSRAINLGKSALESMVGKGSRRAPRRRKAIKRASGKRISRKRSRKPAKKPVKKATSRKRKANTSHTSKAKRRRTNF